MDNIEINIVLRKRKIQRKIKFVKILDKHEQFCYNNMAINGRLAQLGEHLPYKQRVIGSSPILSTKNV